jgi:hypothetical protein
MKTIPMREAFSLVTAVFVMILMASVSIFVLNLSGKIIKTTTAQYQYEQALLYSKSYTEYAILAVTGNDRSIACLSDINGIIGSPTDGNGYRIRTRIAYIVNGTEVDTSKCSSTRLLTTSVQTKKTPLTLIIDAYVDYKDPDNTNGPWFTVHRRTVQKI